MSIELQFDSVKTEWETWRGQCMLVDWREHLNTQQLAWMLNTYSVVASLANKCLETLTTKIFPCDSCPVRITLWVTLHSAKSRWRTSCLHLFGFSYKPAARRCPSASLGLTLSAVYITPWQIGPPSSVCPCSSGKVDLRKCSHDWIMRFRKYFYKPLKPSGLSRLLWLKVKFRSWLHRSQ